MSLTNYVALLWLQVGQPWSRQIPSHHARFEVLAAVLLQIQDCMNVKMKALASFEAWGSIYSKIQRRTFSA